MSAAAVRRWVRARTEAEWVGIAAGAAVFGYLGWDSPLWDARLQLLLHLIALGAVMGLGVIAVRGGALPRTPVDVPVLALLAAFALATASALNIGMSMRAMAAIAATAAMFPVAVVAIRTRPTWVGLLTLVPVLVLGLGSLVHLLERRIEWILVGAPGLPPLRLPGEGTPFGSVAVPAFVFLLALPLSTLVRPAGARLAIRVALLFIGIPLVLLSGSRSAWLAITVAVAVVGAPLAWRRRDLLRPPRSISPGWLAGAVVGLGLAALAAALVVPRLGAVTSLIYRGALWRDTLAAWATDPLLGIGPGFMSYARQDVAADYTLPVRPTHSHNLVLGVLGDAGIAGLAAAAALVVTFFVVAGPWRSRSMAGRLASGSLIGLLVGGMFEDLTFLPNFNLLVLLVAAVALIDADAVRWTRPALLPRTARVAAGGAMVVIAVALVGAMVVADAGGIAYRRGIDLATARAWTDATRAFTRSIEIDPWHPAGPRALSVAADMAQEPEVALAAARRAVALNPGDGAVWTNLGYLCGVAGDRWCQKTAALQAAAHSRYSGLELLNAALLLTPLGEVEAADRAYRLSLLTQPRTFAAADWPRRIAIGTGTIPDFSDASWELNVLLARWAMDEPIEPAAYRDPAVRALAHAMRGERAEAETWLDRATSSQPADIRTWDIAIVLRSAWGRDVSRETRIASVVRGGRFPPRDLQVGIPSRVADTAPWRYYPRDGYVTGVTRMSTVPPFPWPIARTLP